MTTMEDIVDLSRKFRNGMVDWDHWRLYTCQKIMLMEEDKAREFAMYMSREEDSSNV